MNDCKVSVIIPVYNSEESLERCVRSVLGQNFDEMEIILVDDGSEDSSGIICDEFSRNDITIKVIHIENIGPGGARAAGVGMAEGEWLCFVDSDDVLMPGAIQTLYDNTDNDIDIVVSGERNIRRLTSAEFCCELLDFRMWPVWGKLYRRRLWDKFVLSLPKSFRLAEDFLTNLRIIVNIRGRVLTVIPKIYEYTYGNNNGLQHRFKPHYEYEVCVIREAESSIRFLKSSSSYKETIDNHFLKWRYRYMAGMLGLGYPLESSEDWIKTLVSDSWGKRLGYIQKLALLSLDYKVLRMFFRMKKQMKLTIGGYVFKHGRLSF